METLNKSKKEFDQMIENYKNSTAHQTLKKNEVGVEEIIIHNNFYGIGTQNYRNFWESKRGYYPRRVFSYLSIWKC